MAEYMREIPRQKIKAGEKHICPECFHYRECMGRVNRPCIKCDCYIPAADVRDNVKAEWIPFTRFGEWENDGHGVFRPRLLDAGFKCSACGTMKHTKTKWCPDCGAEIIPSAVQVDWVV